MHMHIGEVYAITAFVAALLTGLVYGRMRLPVHRQAIEPAFVAMLGFFLLFNMVDVLWGLCHAGIIRSLAFFTAVGYGYHLLSSASAFVWVLYVLQFARHKKAFRTVILGIALALLTAQLGIIVSNPFHHLVFDVDANNVYTVHSLRYALYALQFAYYAIILLTSGILLRCARVDYREKHKAAFVYSLGPALFCVGQVLFYDVAMYSLGFAHVALTICLYRQSFRIERLRQEQFSSISGEQLSIIHSLTDTCLAIFYADVRSGRYDRFVRADTPTGLEVAHNDDRDFFRAAAEWGRQNVAEVDLEQFLLTIDRENVIRTLAEQPEITMIIKLKQGDGYRYHEGRITHPRGDTDTIIVAIHDIDVKHRAQLRHEEDLARAIERKTALEKEASLLDAAAHRDIMTGLFNRRAYEDDLDAMHGKPEGADFVYVSLDVNGLKAVNDDLGHDAGDELIKGAALCMKQCFGDLGKVYRHGGDEFSAILHVERDRLEALFARFEQVVGEWRGRLVDSLAVSFGHVSIAELPDADIAEMEKLADQRMYDYKMRYYARKGIDRRAQQEAYDALRESYTKVLKVDLKADSFAIIKADEREMDSREGFSDRFSEWSYAFAKSGHVHESDMEEYLQKTRLDYIRNYIAQARGNLAFRYKRKTEDSFRETMMEMIPARDYGADNQIVFLYVKKVSGDGQYQRLHELREGTDVTVQMLWDNNSLEFQSSLVKKDAHGVYIRPYMREDHPLRFDVLVTDTIQCNLFAPTTTGGRVMWHDVELKSVTEGGGVLYLVSTRDFNQYSRPGDRRFHERASSDVRAQVSDMAFVTADVLLNDISDTGLSFHVAEPLKFGSDIINISFVDTINGERFAIDATAKVIRSYPQEGKVFYGCLMVDPSRDYLLYVFMHKLHSRKE